MSDYTCQDCVCHTHDDEPDHCKNQDRKHDPCKDFHPTDYIKALNYDAINITKRTLTMNDLLRKEIKAWKQTNQELDIENLKLKYILFASIFVNLFIGLYFIYENLH